ncbi:MAG: pyridoxine 5'-phosphate synthase [Candidatus Omnitrophica bacterium]|nr:pyridoxine 5'-phosphate synthase [Candidatus Omnitrophota bacterium]
MSVPQLGVNIDHVATVRQARRGAQPDPVAAARLAEQGGCDSIVAHLREDRRHIQDADLFRLERAIRTRLNLEMSLAPEILRVALRLKPDQVTLVPERRQELTTEGGLDVVRHAARIAQALAPLQRRGILVSLFVDPNRRQLAAARRVGAAWVELHTGAYANARTASARRRELQLLRRATSDARRLGLRVNAGHGLDYHNVRPVAAIPDIEELNIGHAIVAQAVFVGMTQAVRDMRRLMGERW